MVRRVDRRTNALPTDRQTDRQTDQRTQPVIEVLCRIICDLLFSRLFTRFLGATKHLYNWLCPLVGLSVCWSVTHSFDDPHVAPIGLLGLV